MFKFVRMDDFPHGDKRRFSKEKGYTYPKDKKRLKEILSIIESYEVPYVLGVTPLLLRDKDIDFLNENVVYGEVCMHGFDHGFKAIEPWPENMGQWHPWWSNGGEFKNMPQSEIEEKYEIGKGILKRVNKYQQEDFILPFDVTTQELLNVISKNKIKRVHTSDSCWKDYNLAQFDYLDLEIVKTIWKSFYDFVKPVVKKIEAGKNVQSEQIGLHWIFDVKLDRSDWEPYYHKFCKLVKGKI